MEKKKTGVRNCFHVHENDYNWDQAALIINHLANCTTEIDVV
jgi:hypothetical protein